VIGLLRLDVGDDAGERLGHMEMHAMAPPVVIAGGALVQQLHRTCLRHRQMRIGQMGEREHRLRCPNRTGVRRHPERSEGSILIRMDPSLRSG
jgi:hypothetical protein